MFQLDLKSRKSIYEQVVDNFKHLILIGVLHEGEKMPSVRELSRLLTVNPNTIQKAYRELERQSFIYTVSGLGTFVAAPSQEKPDANRLNEIKERLRNELKELSYLGLSPEEIQNLIYDLLKTCK